jgi:hypothetical protein
MKRGDELIYDNDHPLGIAEEDETIDPHLLVSLQISVST